MIDPGELKDLGAHFSSDFLGAVGRAGIAHINACRNLIKSRAPNLLDRLPDGDAKLRPALRQFERGLQAATWKADAVFVACRETLWQAGEVTLREPDDIDEFLSNEQLNLVQAAMETALRSGSDRASRHAGIKPGLRRK